MKINFLFFSFVLLFTALLFFSCGNEQTQHTPIADAADSVRLSLLNDSVVATRYVNRDVALTYCDSLIKEAREKNRADMQITGYLSKASILRQAGDIAKAYRNLYQAQELASATRDSVALARVYGNLGHIYYSGLDPYIARDYYQLAAPLFQAAGDSAKYAICLESIGNTYMDVGDYNRAVTYFNLSKSIHDVLHDSAGLFRYYSSMSLIAYMKKDIKGIDSYLAQTQLLMQAGTQPTPEQIVRTLLVEGMGHLFKNNVEQAEKLLNEAEHMAEHDGVQEMLKFTYYQKAAFYKATKRYQEAIAYFEKASVLDEKDKSLQAKSQLSKIYAEISSFGKQKQVELLKEKDELMQKNMSQQRVLLLLFGVFVALLIYTAIAFYRKKEMVQQHNRMLQQQKQDYSNIFNLITDGIAILDQSNRIVDTNQGYHQLLVRADLPDVPFQLPDELLQALPPDKTLTTLTVEGKDEESVTLNISSDELFYLGKQCRMILISDVSNVVKLIENELQLEQSEFSRRITELKLWALRSQMNPHFIFNALNSIQYLIFNKQNDEAITYLTKFSKLLRIVLESSDAKFVSLQQEITQLRLYIEIEQLRFGKDFNYTIHTPGFSETELNQIQIPSMIIQPFVENSLWHGLNHKKGAQQLDVKFEKTDTAIVCSVRDNGIGRQASQELKQNRVSYHHSLGMSKTEERMALLNTAAGEQSSIHIHDLVENGEASGTEVTITMKYTYDHA